MSKHTKGPWHTGQGNGEGSIFADEGRMRFENGTVLYPICTMNTGWDEAEDAANARLVAAAPELLEALQNLENDDGRIPDHAWAMVQAAIAKATGGAA